MSGRRDLDPGPLVPENDVPLVEETSNAEFPLVDALRGLWSRSVGKGSDFVHPLICCEFVSDRNIPALTYLNEVVSLRRSPPAS